MAETTSQREKAEALRRLHSGPEILIIVNAWDAIPGCHRGKLKSVEQCLELQ